MTSSTTAPQTCPSHCAAANHPGYEHDWWVEAFPVTAGLTQALPDTTPCCGASEACRDCPTD